MFATVAVNATVRGGGTALKTTHIAQESLYPGPVFHYDIPATLSSITVPGALIEVPFGPRQAQGLVISLAEAAPVSETKPVTRVLLEEPALDARQIELGMWLSAH